MGRIDNIAGGTYQLLLRVIPYQFTKPWPTAALSVLLVERKPIESLAFGESVNTTSALADP